MFNQFSQWFERRIAPFQSSSNAPLPHDAWSFCWHVGLSIWHVLIAMATLAACVAFLEVYCMQTVSTWIDWLPTCDTTYFFSQHIAYHSWLSFSILILLPGLKTLNNLVVFQALMNNIPMLCRWRIHRHLLQQGMRFYQRHTAGDIHCKLTQTSFAMREVIIKSINVGVFITVYFITSSYTVACIEWQLVPPILIWLCTYLAIMRMHIPKLHTIARDTSHRNARLASDLIDTYANMFLLTISGHPKHHALRSKASMQHTLNATYQHMRLVSRYDIAVCINNSLFVFAMGAITLYHWRMQHLPLGSITFAMTTTLKLRNMSQWIMWETASLFENLGIMQSGMQTLGTPFMLLDTPSADNKPTPSATKAPTHKAAIDFHNVSFGYTPHHNVISDISLSIQPGEKIALIGHTGAGKSTIIHLLLRLYDVSCGSICINQSAIHHVATHSLRQSIAVASQHSGLLKRSIRENITCAVPSASDSDILHALKQACVWDCIQSLRDNKGRTGLDAVIGEGIALSSGERQRIALAGLFLQHSPIVVLDEATSALDAQTEATIQNNLKDFLLHKTVIAASHQLTSLRHMDRLVVMDKGRIVELGSHRTLLQKNGYYAKLWRSQTMHTR